ncbi:hypothetical protein GQ55_9G127500 [Panicum hallii var. hallii]|uniref:Uncharacterized protein n=1 Tax=Panicum hallii var. hallii TaxID=1504633 RepID=A0A2T7C2H0_9POAL|nr:hypothetical protein GQ55_9G127500 [Panicum hallii var. hallii]
MGRQSGVPESRSGVRRGQIRGLQECRPRLLLRGMGTVGGRLPLEALRQVRVRLSLLLLARAAVGSSTGRDGRAQVRLLLLTVEKVHLTTSSSSGICGAWVGSRCFTATFIENTLEWW